MLETGKRSVRASTVFTPTTHNNTLLEPLSHVIVESEAPDLAVKIDTRAQGSCLLMVIRPVNSDSPVLFKVKNDSAHHTVFARQIDCDEYDWQEIGPGCESGYMWEEPLRKQKLLLRVKDTSGVIRGGGEDSGRKRHGWLTSERSNQVTISIHTHLF